MSALSTLYPWSVSIEANEAAHHEPRSDQQHERECHFADHERAAQSLTLPPVPLAVRPLSLSACCGSAREATSAGMSPTSIAVASETPIVNRSASPFTAMRVHPGLNRTSSAGSAPRMSRTPQSASSDAERTANERDGHALGEHLPYEIAARRA